MGLRTVYFTASDNINLKGLLYQSDVTTKKIVIAVHGMKDSCLSLMHDAIAQQCNENLIDYMSFNNRGHDLVSYAEKIVDGKKEKTIAGMCYEDPLDSYQDIKGALTYVKMLGYEEIYLLGHSLGCTKIVYTYHKFLENKENSILEAIKGILLLSLIDIPQVQKFYLNGKYEEILTYAEEKEKQGQYGDLMPEGSFIHPISVKTYLRYMRDNEKINVARYSDPAYQFPILNTISCPLFMRWGTEKEMILQQKEELLEILKNKIQHNVIDIGYIEGANHSYVGKEDILAKEIVRFLREI